MGLSRIGPSSSIFTIVMESSSLDSYCCRICLEEGERREFIAPCKCSGSSKWVHRDCLNKWRSMREDKAFSRCTECLTPYKLVCPEDERGQVTHARRCRFATLLLRDFSVAVLTSQVMVVTIALIVYAFDKHSHALIEAMGQTARPALFYYSMGVFFSLSILGMWYTMIQIGCCGANNDSPPLTCHGANCYCGDACLNPCMYISPHTTTVTTADCCYGANCECCACCGQAATADGAGGAAGCGECSACAGGGEECMVVLIVVVVVFAIIGTVVCVVVGLAYAQKVVRSHYHVLQKYTLASDYVVADLAEGALPLGLGGREDGLGDDVGRDLESGSGSGGGSGSGLLSRWTGADSAASGGGRGGYMRAPTSAVEDSAAIELSVQRSPLQRSTSADRTYLSLPTPSAPPLPAGAGDYLPGGTMERDLSALSSASSDPYAGASAPYDPHVHRFSRDQYQELARRGLV